MPALPALPVPPRRRALAAGLGWSVAALAGCGAAAMTPSAPPRLPMVLSIDDGPLLLPAPGHPPAARHAALRQALARESVTAVMFMTVGFGADRPEGLALARRWAEDGHRLANHTVSHLDLHDPAVTLARYLAEIDACDAVGRTLPNWRRWFRATYLNAGRDAAQQQSLRQGLAERGYQLAAVDLDSRDWQFSAPLQARLLGAADAADAEVAALRERFLAQLDERTAVLAREAEGERRRTPATQPLRPRVLLVHDHLPMALWLPEVLALMRRHGFGFVEPEQAWPVSVPAQY